MNSLKPLTACSVLLVSLCLVSCNKPSQVSVESGGEPPALANASLTDGGALYDTWWKVVGIDAPTENHPLWASRPDTESNTRSGSDTHRCKECHGWDYKGVDVVYSKGSHRTGFPGILGTTLAAREIFTLLKSAPQTQPNGHGYSTLGLSDAQLWSLTKFVLEGAMNLDALIDPNGRFIGDADRGETLFKEPIGANQACATCHGDDGLTKPIDAMTDIVGASPDFEDYPGAIANENPWEFQHKVRFGQPGTSMASTIDQGFTSQELADLGAFVQMLPAKPAEE